MSPAMEFLKCLVGYLVVVMVLAVVASLAVRRG